jgi:hypothetical protein
VFGGRGGASRASEGQFEGSVSVEGGRDVGRWQFVARNLCSFAVVSGKKKRRKIPRKGTPTTCCDTYFIIFAPQI